MKSYHSQNIKSHSDCESDIIMFIFIIILFFLTIASVCILVWYVLTVDTTILHMYTAD